MTSEECIDKIVEVISRPIAESDKPVFHMDGSSTTIAFSSGWGKDMLCRIDEIGLIINEYKKGN